MTCRTGCPTQDCGSSTRCKRCERELPDCQWYFYKSGRDKGLRVYPCRDCNNAARVASRSTEANREASRRWREENPRATRAIRLKAMYGITMASYEAMLAAQGGGCAICNSEHAGPGGSFRVDHDHSCCPGKKSCGQCVRGLLCNTCNVGVGMLRDSEDLLRRAAEYVGSWKQVPLRVS